MCDMEIWYLETSAINELMKELSVEDALATKQLQLDRNREWRLSSVSLWEILMTTDEIRRERLIYFCQNLFSRELLPSPAELIIPFIKKGMPMVESQYRLVSRTAITDTWADLVDDRRKTFIYDQDDLKARVKTIQTQTKSIHQIIKNGDILINSEHQFSGLDFSLSNLVNELPFIKAGEPTSSDEKLSYKVALYYILIILCCEADLDGETVKKYWRDLGIDSTIDRIFYVIKELSVLVHRGSFIVMAMMTISQATGKYPRGVWFDSLHSIYIPYVDQFLTNDDHFVGLRKAVPEPILKRKIHHLKELELVHHKRNQFGTNHT